MKFKVVKKSGGLNVVVWDDGREMRVTDEELVELESGAPKTDKDVIRGLRLTITGLEKKIEALEMEKGSIGDEQIMTGTKYDALLKEKGKLVEENEALAGDLAKVTAERDQYAERLIALEKEQKAKAKAKPEEDKAVEAPAENKAVEVPEETK